MHRVVVTVLAGWFTWLPVAAQDGGSSFGHARARELAELGVLPTPREVVVRDFVNYHRHALPVPAAGRDVALDVRFDRASARLGDEVWLQVGYATQRHADRALAAPVAVALVVDCSSSMAASGKLNAVQRGLRAFVDQLRDDDTVALITFADEARVAVPLRRRGDGHTLHQAIDGLVADGNTNLHAGLMLGLEALNGAELQSARRVVLLTDGIANRGVTEPPAILEQAQQRARGAIDIATIGVGRSLDVDLLQQLAGGARGVFHFVADGEDVHKVFVREAESLLMPAARRVQLRLTLRGERLPTVRAIGEAVRYDGRDLLLDLPDLSTGTTGVVMLRCRLDGAGDELDVDAELTFARVGGGVPTTARERARATLRLGGRATSDDREADSTGAVDREVRKNAAIAVLAAGLADMAAAADDKRWAEANRALALAADEAMRWFPGQDADVQRVRDICAGHRTTLQRYLDRFREL